MTRTVIVCAVVAVLILGVGSLAFAQYDEDKISKVNVRLGLYRPSGQLKEFGGSTWVSLGVDVTLASDQFGRPMRYLSLERTGQKDTGFKASMMPISYNIIWRKDKGQKASGPYVGAGAGLYLLKEEQSEIFLVRPGIDKTAFQIGVSAVAGYDFGQYFFGELRYFKTGELAPNVDFSGMTLFVGARGLF